LVDAGPGRASVLGTLFGVQGEADHGLQVGVLEGTVEVVRLDGSAPPELVRAGRQLRMPLDGATVSTPLEASWRRWLQELSPPAAPKPARIDPPSGPSAQANALPPRFDPAPEAPPKPRLPSELLPGKPPSQVETLEAMVERIIQDTQWIFDDLREEIRRGNCEIVLQRLDNYLADPESPNRPEAVLLRGACLEQLRRWPEARESYRLYLRRWPTGRHVREVEMGLIRTGGW
jgi:hypothetical protein